MSSLQEHIARYERAKAAEAERVAESITAAVQNLEQAVRQYRLHTGRDITLPDHLHPLPELSD